MGFQTRPYGAVIRGVRSVSIKEKGFTVTLTPAFSRKKERGFAGAITLSPALSH